MKLKSILLIVIILAISIFNSCSDNSVDSTLNSNELSKLKKSAITDELSDLIDLREEITQLVIDRKVNIEKLRDAYVNKDVTKIMTLMKMSKNEYNSFNERLLNIRKNILIKYPDIKKAVSKLGKKQCTTCNIEKFFNNFEQYTHASSRYGSGLSKIYTGTTVNGDEDVDCDWVPYTAALVLCAELGPVLYWPCAYVAICSFCEGGWVDDACQ